MENVSASFLDAVRKSMAAIRIALGAAAVDPERLTCAERLQYDGYLRRKATGKAILGLSQQGVPIKKIARATGHSRNFVRNVLRGLTGDVFRARQSSLDAYLPRLDAEWAAGCRNGAELWRRLRASRLLKKVRRGRKIISEPRDSTGNGAILHGETTAPWLFTPQNPAAGEYFSPFRDFFSSLLAASAAACEWSGKGDAEATQRARAGRIVRQGSVGVHPLSVDDHGARQSHEG